MRVFILKASKAYTSPEFSLNNLPGAGRMDLVCRCVSQAVWLSHKLRKDLIFYVVLEGPKNPPLTLKFDSNKLIRFYPDERNIGAHIRNALHQAKYLEKEKEKYLGNGIYISKKSFERLVREIILEKYQVIYLHKKGKPIEKLKLKEKNCFIVGDHLGLSKKNEIFLKKVKAERISLGKIEYLASQAITIINFWLDRIEN